MTKKVILTGLRSNSDLQLGNYFGALLPLVDMAQTKAGEYQINLFVPDLHSFTTPIDYKKLQSGTLTNLKQFVATGLSLENPNLFLYRQSYVPAHSELTWILDCFTGVGELNRMTQFKDKSVNLNDERISAGLFNYPVLMAADILLYGASYVPVGQDQTQHLEFARDIGQRFNKLFGEIFVIPEAVPAQHKFFGKDQGLRIRDLIDPSKKMSKSDESGKGVIFLSDSVELATNKIMNATTDSLAKINYDFDKQAGVSNLLQILSLLTGQSIETVLAEWIGQTSYGALKQSVASALGQFLASFKSKQDSVSEQALKAKLEASEIMMNRQANQTLLKVQRAVGLRP